MKRLFLLASLLLSTQFAIAQSGYDLFQQALVKERAEGNAEAALALYERIGNEYASDRALAARALLQQGLLYEKLGQQAEAQRAFEVAVSRYADQVDIVKQARARLAVSEPPREPSISVRKLWAPGNSQMYGLAPNGQYISYVDWETGAGDLALYEVATGARRRVTDKGSWEASGAFAWRSIFSPDGKQLAYLWYDEEAVSTHGFPELRRIELNGANARVLFKQSGVIAEPYDWSPDGRHILAMISPGDRTTQIALLAVADGSVRVLKSLGWGFPVKMAFSPDGRFVAYDFPRDEGQPERDLFVLATDGSREVKLADHPANDILIGWAPDGRSILFGSDRTGSVSLWGIEMSGGQASGEPYLVKPDLGNIKPIGITRYGTLFYTTQVSEVDAYTVDLAPSADTVSSSPAPINPRFVGLNDDADYSPDGAFLAYKTTRDPKGPFSPPILALYSTKTGEERLIPLETDYFYNPRWSPDGRSILVNGADKKGRIGIYSVDGQTGDLSPLVQHDSLLGNSRAQWSPYGDAIYYRMFLPDGRKLLRKDLTTGREQTLLYQRENSAIGPFDVSPDDRQLVFVRRDTLGSVLQVMPARGGEPQDLFRFADSMLDFPVWTPDGKAIVFTSNQHWLEQPHKLWYLDVAGGEPREMGVAMTRLREVRIRPDGRQIAFTAGHERLEIWVMDGFLNERPGKGE